MASENQQPARLVPTQDIVSRIATELRLFGADVLSQPDSITFAGNGEPTLHPGFSELVEVVGQLRDRWLPDIPMNLFTDGMHLADPTVRAATRRFRRVFLKIDGASEAVTERINGPGSWRGMRRAVAVGRELDNIAASTALVGSVDANTADVRSGHFVDLVFQLQPRELYLYTLDYPSLSAVAVDFSTLIETADWLAHRVECPVVALWRRHRHATEIHENIHG